MTDLSPFPLPFVGGDSMEPVARPRTLRELEMMRCSAHIREKSEWFVKMRDPDIVDRWTREARDQGMTPAQIRYVLAELEHYAALRDAHTGIEVSAVDGVWQSDTLIDDQLRARLREAVRPLEDVPEAERDWHPGSNGQVLDLVHPSLFCLVREVSGAPESAWRHRAAGGHMFSERFQWLPTDVDVSEDGDVTFRSYVNNVHPVAHRDLADVLPVLFGRMRPLLENVLTDLRHPRPLRIEADCSAWYDDCPEPTEPDDDADDDAWEQYDLAWEEWLEDREPTIPDAPDFVPPPRPDDSARVDLRGRRLQVIAKLAAIHLTPDKPEYPGGSWHVEGMLNERIVATCIYYWDSENITESRLNFRAAVAQPNYEQNDHRGVAAVYGLTNGASLQQELGSARSMAGRCLAFPNIYQHRVSPFRLQDPTRPGYRKILVFFLVDPSTRIVSTADIPPQQPWADTATMTLEEAKRYREELMRERKYFVDKNTEVVYEREFSLCEH